MSWVEPDDRHGRQWAEILRVNCVQERLRKAGKFGIKFDLYPGRKKRESLEETLHKRIGADLFGFAIQGQASGNFRKLLRELSRRLPQMRKLDVVMIQEPAIDGAERFGSCIIREQPQNCISDCILTGIKIDLGPHIELLRHRIGPEITTDFNGDPICKFLRT